MTDEIKLILPAQEDFHPVAHLVVGGLAARLELTYEQLEDLQTFSAREFAGALLN